MTRKSVIGAEDAATMNSRENGKNVRISLYIEEVNESLLHVEYGTPPVELEQKLIQGSSVIESKIYLSPTKDVPTIPINRYGW